MAAAAARRPRRSPTFDLADAIGDNALAGYGSPRTSRSTNPSRAEQMGSNHQYFLDAVRPVARRQPAFASHCIRRPAPSTLPLGGIARLFTRPARPRTRAGNRPARQIVGAELLHRNHSEINGEQSINEVSESSALSPVRPFRDVQARSTRFVNASSDEGTSDRPSPSAACGGRLQMLRHRRYVHLLFFFSFFFFPLR